MGWDRSILRPPNGGFLLAAQDSPNGLRNGQKDRGAITPIAGATNGNQTFERVTVAGYTMVEGLRNETSCKTTAKSHQTCNAKILTPPGRPKANAAYRRGTRYEGSCRHEHVGKGVQITCVVLD